MRGVQRQVIDQPFVEQNGRVGKKYPTPAKTVNGLLLTRLDSIHLETYAM